MCDAVSLTVAAIGTSAALGFASSDAQFQAGEQAANAQYEYQVALQKQRQEQIQENYQRTLEAYRFQLNAENARIEEVRKAASAQAFNINVAALRARSSAAAAAASRGAAGQSTYLSLLDYIAQAGQQIGGIGAQLRAEEAQSHRNRQAMWIEAKNRAASIQPYIPAPVQGPMDTTLIDTASNALGAAATFGLPLIQADRATRQATTGPSSTPALGIPTT